MRRLAQASALDSVLGLALVAAAPTVASAAPWSRSFVVDWMEPAFYHGGAGEPRAWRQVGFVRRDLYGAGGEFQRAARLR